MAKRAMTLRQVQNEKLARGGTWFFIVMRNGLQVGDRVLHFPQALDLGAAGGANLFDEEEVDRFVEALVAAAKALAAARAGKRAARSERATFVRSKRSRPQAEGPAHAAGVPDGTR